MHSNKWGFSKCPQPQNRFMDPRHGPCINTSFTATNHPKPFPKEITSRPTPTLAFFPHLVLAIKSFPWRWVLHPANHGSNVHGCLFLLTLGPKRENLLKPIGRTWKRATKNGINKTSRVWSLATFQYSASFCLAVSFINVVGTPQDSFSLCFDIGTFKSKFKRNMVRDTTPLHPPIKAKFAYLI